MDPVRRRRYGSCSDCGWIYELATAPTDCAECGVGLGRRGTRPFHRAVYATDGQAHVASHVKASAASARAPWAERLASELDARHARRRPDARLTETSRDAFGSRADARVVPGGSDTTMDALTELGGLRLSSTQIATRATLAGAVMMALLAWIVL